MFIYCFQKNNSVNVLAAWALKFIFSVIKFTNTFPG